MEQQTIKFAMNLKILIVYCGNKTIILQPLTLTFYFKMQKKQEWKQPHRNLLKLLKILRLTKSQLSVLVLKAIVLEFLHFAKTTNFPFLI